jgi:hypothetical protein
MSASGALGLPQLGWTASNGPLLVAETSAVEADRPRIAVRLVNRIRTSADMPPEDSDVVLLPTLRPSADRYRAGGAGWRATAVVAGDHPAVAALTCWSRSSLPGFPSRAGLAGRRAVLPSLSLPRHGLERGGP